MRIKFKHLNRALWVLIFMLGTVFINHAHASANGKGGETAVLPFPKIGPINRGFVKSEVDGSQLVDSHVSDVDPWIIAESASKKGEPESESVNTQDAADDDDDGDDGDDGVVNKLPHSQGIQIPSLPLRQGPPMVNLVSTDGDEHKKARTKKAKKKKKHNRSASKQIFAASHDTGMKASASVAADNDPKDKDQLEESDVSFDVSSGVFSDQSNSGDIVAVASSSQSTKKARAEKKKEKPEGVSKRDHRRAKKEKKSKRLTDDNMTSDDDYVQVNAKNELVMSDGGSIDLKPTSFSLHLMGQGEYKSSKFSCLPQANNVFGIARLINADEGLDETLLFDMLADNRCVGRMQFDNLTPNTNYKIQMGYARGDKASFSNEVKSNDFNWDQAHEFDVRTPPEKPGDIASFVYGSCARISSLGPFDFNKRDTSRILQAMHDDIVARRAQQEPLLTDAILTLGDFPYMDFWGPVFPAKTFKGFCERNELLYGLSGCRNLMDGSIPVHQVRDDHEVKNDSSAEVPNGKQRMYADAQKSYNIFQRPQGGATLHPWQEVTAGNLEAFMLDIRSERFPSQNPPQMISPAQMDALKTWLLDESRVDRIKPIMISNPFLCLQTDDTFSGFPDQQCEILNFIKEYKIKYVSFFAGDIHFGKTGLWKFDEEDMPLIFEDVSSSLRNIAGGKLDKMQQELDLTEKAGIRLSTVGDLSPSITEDLYTRVILNHPEHKIRIIKRNRENELLSDVEYDLDNGTYNDIEQVDKAATFSHVYAPQVNDNDGVEMHL